jgi:hypothetical protein
MGNPCVPRSCKKGSSKGSSLATSAATCTVHLAAPTANKADHLPELNHAWDTLTTQPKKALRACTRAVSMHQRTPTSSWCSPNSGCITHVIMVQP